MRLLKQLTGWPVRGLALFLAFAAPIPAYAGRNWCQSYYCYPPAYNQRVVAQKQAVVAQAAKPAYNTTTTDNSISYSYTFNASQLPQAQGATVYGYPAQGAFNLQASLYSNTDLAAAMNQAVRLVADGQAYGAQAFSELKDVIAAQSASNQRVAEILAKGHVAAAVLNASNAASSAEINVQAGAGAAPVAGMDQLDDADLLAKVQQVFGSRCATCHGAPDKPELPAFNDLSKIDAVLVNKILERVTAADPEKRMPPGKSLPLAEIHLLFQAAEPPQ